MNITLKIVSDLHLEFEDYVGRSDLIRSKIKIPFDGERYLILSGDITCGLNDFNWFVDLLKTRHVLYVHGNHEYYGYNITTIQETCNDFYKRINEEAVKCGYPGRLFYLNNSMMIDHEVSLCVFGATLWTNIMIEDRELIGRSMNDYRLIDKNCASSTRTLKVSDTVEIHKKTVMELEKFIEYTNTADLYTYKKVVITHHLPSFKSISPMYEGHQLNVAYATELDSLCKKVDLWTHGHTHGSADYSIGKCRVFCNPRGYYPHRVNPNFNASKTISI